MTPRKRKRGPGWARVPNSTLDGLALAGLPAREYQVVLALGLRGVYGWRDRRTTQTVSVSRAELAAATGLAETHVRAALQGLEQRGIVRRLSTPKKGAPAVYYFEHRPSRWNTEITQSKPKNEGPNQTPISGSKSDPEQVFRVQNGTKWGSESDPYLGRNARNHAPREVGKKEKERERVQTPSLGVALGGSPTNVDEGLEAWLDESYRRAEESA